MRTLPWTIADHLGDDDAAAAYLDAVLEDGEPSLIAAALRDIAEAKGIDDLAARTGMTDERLLTIMSGRSNADFAGVLKVVAALGLQLNARRATPVEAA